MDTILKAITGKKDIKLVNIVRGSTEGIWVQRPRTNKIEFINGYDLLVSFAEEKIFEVEDNYPDDDLTKLGDDFPFDEYGDTWALTKEELL